MIPVPDSEIELYDVDGESDKAFKDLVAEELIYIRKNENKIRKNAKVLYSKKKAGDNNNKVVANCLDFTGTVFEVNLMTYIEPGTNYAAEGECNFMVNVSKDGQVQEPDRMISLNRITDSWEVASEGF